MNLSRIEREDPETVSIVLYGNIGFTTPKAEVLAIDGIDREDASIACACEQAVVTLRDQELQELCRLLATFEKED